MMGRGLAPFYSLFLADVRRVAFGFSSACSLSGVDVSSALTSSCGSWVPVRSANGAAAGA